VDPVERIAEAIRVTRSRPAQACRRQLAAREDFEMPALTVSEIKQAIVSDDGTTTSVTFTTKYVGDLDVTMPSSCVDRLIAVLQDAKSKLQPKASPQLEAQPKASPEPAASLQPNQVRVTVPKTWAVTADSRQHGLVIVVFDHQADTRAGYALSPDAARKLSEGLAKNAEAVLLNRNHAKGDKMRVTSIEVKPPPGKS